MVLRTSADSSPSLRILPRGSQLAATRARSRRPSESAVALDLGQVRDVLGVLRVLARSPAEPSIEDLDQLGGRGCPQAERQYVRVVEAAGPLSGLRVGT